MDNMLYNREIEDELMIQFIIMYTLNQSDEALAYADLLSIIQENCEISFTDLQLAIDNLINTEHISKLDINNTLTIFNITQKGKSVIDFFYKQIPLIIREPIDESIRKLYHEKRMESSVRATIEPLNRKEFAAKCELRDDKTPLLALTIYTGDRAEAERIVRYYKDNSETVYAKILEIFNDID